MSLYSEKLKDPRWQKKRLGILDRDDWACQHCGSKDRTLHVHHIKYESHDPWETDDKWLLTLCAECHEYDRDYRDRNVGLVMDLVLYSKLCNEDLGRLVFVFDDRPEVLEDFISCLRSLYDKHVIGSEYEVVE